MVVDRIVSLHEEWGIPKKTDRRLFEDLVLDGAQAGLSWLTILRKRENYRILSFFHSPYANFRFSCYFRNIRYNLR
jgi:DNA-3-methyladenine glycosylase I